MLMYNTSLYARLRLFFNHINMKILCQILGHKWIKNDPWLQYCARCGCHRHKHIYHKTVAGLGCVFTKWVINH